MIAMFSRREGRSCRRFMIGIKYFIDSLANGFSSGPTCLQQGVKIIDVSRVGVCITTYVCMCVHACVKRAVDEYLHDQLTQSPTGVAADIRVLRLQILVESSHNLWDARMEVTDAYTGEVADETER